jgi:DNA invertase Pin-like site-specific DNA recombinase
MQFEGMNYGDARVSTDDQNPALQLAALKKAGYSALFKDEVISGATTKRRALLRCLAALEPGDTLIDWKLDLLGRNLRDLIYIRGVAKFCARPPAKALAGRTRHSLQDSG